MTFLLFVHVVSGLFVLIGSYAAEQSRSDQANVGNWLIVMVLIIIGLILFLCLIVRGCQNRLRAQGITVSRMTGPSLSLRIFFLGIFGVAVIIQVLINLAIYIQCISLMPIRNIRDVFTMMSNETMLILLLIHTKRILTSAADPYRCHLY